MINQPSNLFIRNQLLANESSGTESVHENLSESGSSNYAEDPIDFKPFMPTVQGMCHETGVLFSLPN